MLQHARAPLIAGVLVTAVIVLVAILGARAGRPQGNESESPTTITAESREGNAPARSNPASGERRATPSTDSSSTPDNVVAPTEVETDHELTADQEWARGHLSALDGLHEATQTGSLRRRTIGMPLLLKVSLATIQDELGQYVDSGPMHPENEDGVPLQFIVNGRGYYFAADTFPEYAELLQCCESCNIQGVGLPDALVEQIYEAYREARGILEERAGS